MTRLSLRCCPFKHLLDELIQLGYCPLCVRLVVSSGIFNGAVRNLQVNFGSWVKRFAFEWTGSSCFVESFSKCDEGIWEWLERLYLLIGRETAEGCVYDVFKLLLGVEPAQSIGRYGNVPTWLSSPTSQHDRWWIIIAGKYLPQLPWNPTSNKLTLFEQSHLSFVFFNTIGCIGGQITLPSSCNVLARKEHWIVEANRPAPLGPLDLQA